MKKKRQRSFGKKSRKAKQQQKRQQEPKQAVRDEQATIPIIPSNSTNATTTANYRTSEALSDRNGNLRLAEGAFNWSAAVDVLGQQLLERFIAKILESRPSFHISGELISNCWGSCNKLPRQIQKQRLKNKLIYEAWSICKAQKKRQVI